MLLSCDLRVRARSNTGPIDGQNNINVLNRSIEYENGDLLYQVHLIMFVKLVNVLWSRLYRSLIPIPDLVEGNPLGHGVLTSNGKI
ncbi:hypothetical protein RIR_jg31099.t2 [Rhizophagus irregularis DAOM 181602=DAOM 197198]|nr:hypothetical protein RIR_jg31099.t2 [Rhizophagus irregularis DAOM 181602=DAOM 197198]